MSSKRLQALKSTYQPPVRSDRRYMHLSEQMVGLRDLNGRRGLARRVILSGMSLVVDEADTSGLLKSTRDADDVAEVYLVADDLTIATCVKLPGTHVYIYARSLTFSDEDARVDTSAPPRPDVRPPNTKDGRDGLPAGDVTVVVREFHPATPTSHHIYAVGGAGEPGDDGGLVKGTGSRRDLKPVTAKEWDGLMSPSHRSVPHENMGINLYRATLPPVSFDAIQSQRPDSRGKITYAAICNIHYTNVGHTSWSHMLTIAEIGSKDLPGKGPDAAPPGRPGTGGAGGCLVGVRDAVPSFVGDGGTSGARRPPSPGGQGGTPDRPLWVFFEGRPDGSRHNFTTRWETKERPSPGRPSVQGPPPARPSGPSRAPRIVDGHGACAWVNAVSLGTVLDYAHDAVAAHDWSAALEALEPYLDVLLAHSESGTIDSERVTAIAAEIPDVLGDANGLSVAAHEALGIREAAGDFLDEYGHPVGWAPSVSLETAVDLYSAVLDTAITQLSLSHTLQAATSTVEKRHHDLDAMIEALTAASHEARSELVAARSALVTTNPATGASPLRELAALMAECTRKGDELKERLEQLRRKADEQQAADDVKHAIASGLKIGGALVRAIPLPEPYQTATRGIDVISQATAAFIDGDSDTAFKNLQTGVTEFTERKDLADAFTTDLDATIGAHDQRSADLKVQAASVAEQLAGLKSADKEIPKAEKERDAAVKQVSTQTPGDDPAKTAANAQKLAAATQNLIDKKAMLEANQKKLDATTAALSTAKKQRADTVKSAAAKIQNVASAAAQIGQEINALMVYEADLDSRWAETLKGIVAKDSKLATIKRDIDHLNRRKRAVALVIKGHTKKMEEAAAIIDRNAVALVELRTQYARDHQTLDPQATGFIQAVERDARSALARFLYYVVKAYEYYTVKPWKDSQYTMINQIVNKIGRLLSSARYAESTAIDPDDLATLKTAYEVPLTSMAREIADAMTTGRGGRQDIFSDTLPVPKHVLQELGSSLASEGSTATVVVNPAALGWMDTGKERQRVRQITVTSIRARPVGDAPLPDRIAISFVHTGQSILRADGHLYAFASSDHDGASSTRAGVSWETRASGSGLWVPRPDTPGEFEIRADALTTPKPGSEGNLLSKLLKDSPAAAELATLSRFRPGGFSDLDLIVEVTPSSARMELTDLWVTLEQEAVPDPYRSMIAVTTSLDVPVPIVLSRPDLSGSDRGDGDLYAILETSDLKSDPLRISTPARIAGHAFRRWLIDSRPASTTEPSISLSRACTAHAEYAPM